MSVRGWCPGALRPMMSGDGLVLRIRQDDDGKCVVVISIIDYH